MHKFLQYLQQLIKSSQNGFMQLYMHFINEQDYRHNRLKNRKLRLLFTYN
ncbi:hypothetical protein BTHERMOSOX_1176 [Bathymodiolus thermophilus thioautotrophic gill symbiont]|nr:hypothetical protein BTHERMOSOX_1176 [Bathymodiolus thermophilus thioautotrophic gill symbiont]